MNKYFINEKIVDEDEFYAEVKAECHAFFDENLEENLNEASDNYKDEIRIGTFEYTNSTLLKLLPEQIQKDIIDSLYDYFEYQCLYELVYDGYLVFRVYGDIFCFEIDEVEK
jgi:hypothetical protein